MKPSTIAIVAGGTALVGGGIVSQYVPGPTGEAAAYVGYAGGLAIGAGIGAKVGGILGAIVGGVLAVPVMGLGVDRAISAAVI